MTISSPPYGMACMLNIFAADSTLSSLPPALEAISKLGYTHVVLPPIDIPTTNIKALAKLLRDYSVSPITIFGGLTHSTLIGSPLPEERAAGVASIKKVIDLTVALGGTQMNGVPYGEFGPSASPPPASYIETAAVELGKVANYGYNAGVMMTFEVLNRYETSIVNTAQQAMDFVGMSNSENLMIHLDTFHMAIEESDLLAAIELAMPRLGYLELGQSGRGRLSEGVVNVSEVVSHARRCGYDGVIGVEAFARSILPPSVANALSIWREPFDDGYTLAKEAARIIRQEAS